MNPNLKRFLIIFIITVIVHFPLFYLFEEDKTCVFDWGSKCSNSYLFRTSFQTIFLTLLLFYFNRTKKVNKQ